VLDPSGSKQTYHLPVVQHISTTPDAPDVLVYENEQVSSWSELLSRIRLARDRIVRGSPFAHV